MTKQVRSIYLAIGITTLVFTVRLYWVLFESPTAQLGKSAGFSSPTYVISSSVADDVAAKRNVNAAELIVLRKLADDDHPLIRAKALTALFYVTGSNEIEASRNIARSKIHDPHSTVRQYALSALDHLNAPEIITLSREMLSDPEENVRVKASMILKKRATTNVH